MTRAMSRVVELRATLARCEARARQAERALHTFAGAADLTQPAAIRRHSQLRSAWLRALRDVTWVREALERALDLDRIRVGTDA